METTEKNESNEERGAAKIPLERPVMPLKYAVEQRMRFLDFLFENYGNVGRIQLTDYFGISTPQATKDFKTYMKIAPDNVRYNTSQKSYVKNPEFKRVWA